MLVSLCVSVLVSMCVSVLVSMCVRACERANLQAPCWLQELSQRVVSLASAIHSGATVSPLQTGRGNSVEQTTDVWVTGWSAFQ